ncbi:PHOTOSYNTHETIC NDH SUBUNIT OF SUBCOMPLEX B 2 CHLOROPLASTIC [Salix koriyanagi]|uniref:PHOTOSYNTHETIC NDH SUBUNIT OF SUBCOMPLEX B 2 CHLOROPLASTIC n=1 Tax=Salix koriyanagi TaxID=2511006 RepID=A0A9Q1A8F6_9ROSI|nr:PHOTOSYNTHETIC NDH SUBUNIT OF SUBCOMPLEX B 2 CHLOROPLASTIC [Salix koriyanagi]
MACLLSFSLPKPSVIKATALSPTTNSPSAPDVLEEKFGRKGIKFLESNNVPSVELKVRNGSSVMVQIPNAHISSYKPKVYWKDDGFEEVLYTLPAKGGIGLVINDASEGGSKGSLISSSEWTVKDVDSDSIDAVQVELSCSSGPLEISYVVSLYPLSMASAVIVKNNGRKDSVSPSEALKPESPGLLDFDFEPEEKPGSWKVQEEPYIILKDRLSRVYAAPPQERLKAFYNTSPTKYETLDQGKELFFRVIRIGFEDIYVGSPGSSAEKYGKDYFICTGPAAMLVPVVVKPGGEWKGAQMIEHDNL